MLSINLKGDESKQVLNAVRAAVNAYYGALIQPSAERVLKESGFKGSMSPGDPTIVTVSSDTIGRRESGAPQPQVIENPSHSYTEGMTVTADPAQVFSEEICGHTESPDSLPDGNYPLIAGIDVQENGAVMVHGGVTIELDAAGKPWDEKIHSSSREKTRDGCWKFKRGLDPALRNAAQVEIKPQIIINNTGEFPGGVSQIPPPPAPPAPAAEAHTLPWLMGVAAKAQKTKADIDAALAACGLKTIPDLLAQLDKMDDVARALGVL